MCLFVFLIFDWFVVIFGCLIYVDSYAQSNFDHVILKTWSQWRLVLLYVDTFCIYPRSSTVFGISKDRCAYTYTVHVIWQFCAIHNIKTMKLVWSGCNTRFASRTSKLKLTNTGTRTWNLVHNNCQNEMITWLKWLITCTVKMDWLNYWPGEMHDFVPSVQSACTNLSLFNW